jgi:hypothetical protein
LEFNKNSRKSGCIEDQIIISPTTIKMRISKSAKMFEPTAVLQHHDVTGTPHGSKEAAIYRNAQLHIGRRIANLASILGMPISEITEETITTAATAATADALEDTAKTLRSAIPILKTVPKGLTPAAIDGSIDVASIGNAVTHTEAPVKVAKAVKSAVAPKAAKSAAPAAAGTPMTLDEAKRYLKKHSKPGRPSQAVLDARAIVAAAAEGADAGKPAAPKAPKAVKASAPKKAAPKKSAAPAAAGTPMTLDEAKRYLKKHSKPGRPSQAVLDARAIVAAAEGADAGKPAAPKKKSNPAVNTAPSVATTPSVMAASAASAESSASPAFTTPVPATVLASPGKMPAIPQSPDAVGMPPLHTN